MKNNKHYRILVTTIFMILFFIVDIAAQQIGRGDPNALRIGVHRGNQVRTVFSNLGVIAQPGNQGPRGAWKYDNNGYVGDVSPLVGVKIPIDSNGDGIADKDTFSVVITNVSRPGGGDSSPGGTAWTFQPIPGFFNDLLDEEGKGVAMSHQPETWPSIWPDQPGWIDGQGNAEWNGYFGRDQFNADQESYFWMDDNQDEKFFQRLGFLPDSTDPTRKGQALQVAVRGMQWSNFLAQDVLFWLYDINNVGTTTYTQTVFGFLVGTYVGVEDPEYNDDVSFFDIRDNITYTFDFDKYISPSANPRWLPTPSDVGVLAYAFLESPGNPFDGIDNDADNRNFDGSAPYFDGVSFLPRTVQAGDKLILIDPVTFARSEFIVPNTQVTVQSMGKSFTINPGVTTLTEGAANAQGAIGPDATDGIDNDLDGLIDENSQVHYRQFQKAGTQTLIDTLNPVQYFDYSKSLTNTLPMIDEARDDLIDNDSDWDPAFDDVGADGKPGTGDMGEGDGVPTPGEPNFDRTDVDESDQIGLTSFQYFVPAGDISMSDENDMWRRLRPGFFSVPTIFVNGVATRGEDGDFIYGSGYFPLLPKKTERFSLALAFGEDLQAVFKTKRVAQLIYDANYNFPRPPEKPTLTAVAGDGKVTLYWDRVAEESVDPTTKVKDFEGYKIYKGTDPDLTDAFTLTNGRGIAKAYKPVAQFDLKNGLRGYFPLTVQLNDLLDGLPFFLGEDSGIKNTWVDNDVINGRTYYYAVVAYDRGDADKEIYPSENNVFIAKNNIGEILLDINTAAVVPNAPVAGYIPPEDGQQLTRVSGASETIPFFSVIDETRVETSAYEVVIIDSLVNRTPLGYAYNVVKTATNDTLFSEPQPLKADNNTVFDGINLSFNTSYQTIDSVKLNRAASGWVDGDSTYLNYAAYKQVFSAQSGVVNFKDPKTYALVFYDDFNIQSVDPTLVTSLPANPNFAQKMVNFEVFDMTNKETPVKLPFIPSGRNIDTFKVAAGSRLFLIDENSTTITWTVDFAGDTTKTHKPVGGDTLYINFRKPLTSKDKFSFSTVAAGYDPEKAKNDIKEVRAVPNPYVVTNIFEEPLPSTVTGRGERVINFINLPPSSKIHIYTSSGNHVTTIEHNGTIQNGTVSWDLRTKEGLDVAFGVYFYVVEADGISEKKFGKLAIIK